MKKYFKRSLSVLLSALMAGTALSASAIATAATVTTSSPVAAKSYGLPDKIEDGAILHCWCWSFNTIKENIPQIAAAGFKSIQTSPINKVWDGNKNGDMSLKSSNKGNWWYQYQPVDFTIGNYQLGTEDEFKAMCEEAHKYGVKVVVDIVSNHCTSEFSAISARVKNVAGSSKTTFHPVTQISDWSNRYQVTQGHLTGLWDLNTQNAKVQQMIYNYITHVLDDGADGFRFDAAKHIELPDDDASYAGNYWTTILNNDAEFQYGEILLGADRAADYAKLMKITAEGYGTNLRAGLEKKKVTAATAKNYRIADVDAGQLITWVESHDTYCTDDIPSQQQYSSWMKINNEQVQQGWAIIASQGDTTPLFFARPKGSQAYDPNESSPTSKKNFNNKWGENTIGIAGDGNYFSDEVVAVNKFRNAMVGESKNVVDAVKSKVTMIERGTKGAVLVNVTDADVDVSVTTKIADGEYTDQANGGTFTVKNGKLTGTVPAGAVAVVYTPEEEGDDDVIVGDLDGDGEVTVKDATILQRHLAEFTNEDGSAIVDETDPKAVKVADVDGDGSITVMDVSAIQRIVAEFSAVPA